MKCKWDNSFKAIYIVLAHTGISIKLAIAIIIIITTTTTKAMEKE